MGSNEENEHENDKESEEPGKAVQIEGTTNTGVPEEYFNEAVRLDRIKDEIAILERPAELKRPSDSEQDQKLRLFYEERNAIDKYLDGESDNPLAWNDKLPVFLQCSSAKPMGVLSSAKNQDVPIRAECHTENHSIGGRPKSPLREAAKAWYHLGYSYKILDKSLYNYNEMHEKPAGLPPASPPPCRLWKKR